MRDSERETHSDGAAFLVGYLLGLPCFCFKPDVAEALIMLRDSPEALNLYRQPKAALVNKKGVSVGGGGSKGGLFDNMFSKFSSSSTPSPTTATTTSTATISSATTLAEFRLPEIPPTNKRDLVTADDGNIVIV